MDGECRRRWDCCGQRGRVLQLQGRYAEALRSPSAPSGRESSSMSSSSSRATSRINIPSRVEMPSFVCPRCRADVVRRISHTPKNSNRPFYVCSDKGVSIGGNFTMLVIGILEEYR